MKRQKHLQSRVFVIARREKREVIIITYACRAVGKLVVGYWWQLLLITKLRPSPFFPGTIIHAEQFLFVTRLPGEKFSKEAIKFSIRIFFLPLLISNRAVTEKRNCYKYLLRKSLLPRIFAFFSGEDCFPFHFPI